MPGAAGFRRALGVSVGDSIPGTRSTVTYSKIGFVTKKRIERSVCSFGSDYRMRVELFRVGVGRYELPIKLKLASDDSDLGTEDARARFLARFSSAVSESKIEYSSYGTPYECSFGTPKITNWAAKDGTVHVEVQSTGTMTRRRDLPNQSELVLQSEKKQERTIERAKRAAERKGYIVQRAQFGGAMCRACEREIEKAELVARKEEEGRTRRRGWVHLLCVG